MSKTTKQINKITSTIIIIAIRVIFIAVVVVVLTNGIKIAYNFGHSIFYATSVEPAPGRDVVVTIPEGSTAKEASEILVQKGLIDNKYSAIVQTKFFEYEVKPGTYKLNTSMTTREILQQLNEGTEETEDA